MVRGLIGAAAGDSVCPRRLSGVIARPFNFTVRGQLVCPYWRMARAPYAGYTSGGEPKLRVGSGQGRAEPAEARRGVCGRAGCLLGPSTCNCQGSEERRSMKRSRKYRDEPLGRLEVVEDFLPPPDQLVLRDDGVKITISLSKRSVDFFKRHAARSKVPYQKMIRSLLDTYAKHHGADL